MASTKNYFPSQIQFPASTDHAVEFDESDIWRTGDGRTTLISQSSLESHLKSQIPPPRTWKKSSARKIASDPGRSGYPAEIPAPSSLPVNIPDWSKILGAVGEDPDGDVDGSDEEEEEEWMPPHEYAARQLAKRSGKVVAHSVHEGVGRTLKGRDLWRVRNAILKQTGFED